MPIYLALVLLASLSLRLNGSSIKSSSLFLLSISHFLVYKGIHCASLFACNMTFRKLVSFNLFKALNVFGECGYCKKSTVPPPLELVKPYDVDNWRSMQLSNGA